MARDQKDQESKPKSRLDEKFDQLVAWSKSDTKSGKEIAADLKKKQSERKAARQARKEEKEKKPLPLGVLIGGGLAVVGIVAGVVSTGLQAHDYSGDIQKLEAALKSTQMQTEALPEQGQAREATMQLQKKADRVAQLQNEYRGWVTSTDPKDEARTVDLHQRLSKEVGAEAASQWYLPLKEKDGAVVPLSAKEYKWESTVNYEVADMSAMPVSWLCHSSDGKLLAWATAQYDGVNDELSGLRTGVTSVGGRYLISDDTSHGHDNSGGERNNG